MFVPKNEQGVIVLFSQLAEAAGWHFVEVGQSFPDAILSKDGEEWQVEFEFMSSNFLDHKHDHRKCDMIICWINDYEGCSLPIMEVSSKDSIVQKYQKAPEHKKEIEYWRVRAHRAERAAKGKNTGPFVSQANNIDGSEHDVLNAIVKNRWSGLSSAEVKRLLSETFGYSPKTAERRLQKLERDGRLASLNGHVEVTR